MDSDNAKRRRFAKFSVKGFLTLVAFLAVCLGWWVDRSQLKEQMDRLGKQAAYGKGRFLFTLMESEMELEEWTVKDQPRIGELADGTFDESFAPKHWERARRVHPGEQCIGYYYNGTWPEERDKRFYVFTVDGKIALVDAGMIPSRRLTGP